MDPHAERPQVTVLHAPDDRPPGLEPLMEEARLVYADCAETLRDALPHTDVLLVTDFRTTLLRECWHLAQRLRWVHATSAGVDALLFPASRASQVPLTNARGIFDRAIAETVLGMILMFAKDFMGSLALKREHRWRHRDTERAEGARVLIVGAGSIGRQIARLTRAVGLNPEGIARSARPGDDDFLAVHAQDQLLDRLPEADYVVVAAPLTPATQGLFGAEAFRRMKPTARFINVGRGQIVQTDALVSALQQKRIAGAALDVFEEEPLPPGHPLWELPQVFMSAHMAGDFFGWREALSAQFIDNFRRWRAGEPLRNLVDKSQGYVPPTQE